MDNGPSMGLLAHGLHIKPPKTLAGPQSLPGPVQPQGDIRQQDITVGVVHMHEGGVWSKRVLLHA